MSYYLGKVGRAGARLVSSCKDLYYDVNAAYLTGAVDIIVVKQQDGSLKSTPFHVRFGKLGVLRTGDQKEVCKIVRGGGGGGGGGETPKNREREREEGGQEGEKEKEIVWKERVVCIPYGIPHDDYSD